MRLSADMCRSIAVAAGTQLLPGTRVRWKDREAPLPERRRLAGRVTELDLSFNGKALVLFGVTVRWDKPLGDGVHADSLCVDELDQLEILP